MIYRNIILIFLFAVTFTDAQTPINEWRGIIPLRTTKSDVEKLLGKPIKADMDLYDSENERVIVWYSEGNCKENKSSVYNVSKETVLGFIVSPKKAFKVNELIEKLPQSFEKIKDVEIEGVFHYFSKDGSVQFETRIMENGAEDVIFIVYKPGELGKNLRCSSVQKKN